MDRPRHEHQDERQREREQIDPRRVAEKPEAGDTRQRADQMTSEQRAWLRSRRTGQSEQKDGGTTERSEQQG